MAQHRNAGLADMEEPEVVPHGLSAEEAHAAVRADLEEHWRRRNKFLAALDISNPPADGPEIS